MAKTRQKTIKVAPLKGTGQVRPGARGRNRSATDREREDRITMEVVVDAYDAAERAMGWFAYLERELQFPFTARCTERRAISPLLVGDEVDVVSIAPAAECSHEIFVMIRWEHGGLGVPLSQLEPTGSDSKTEVAASDWRYWVRKGYRF